MLIPDSRIDEIPDMKWGAEYVIVSHVRDYPAEEKEYAVELLFEDGSQSPYSLDLSPGQTDRRIPESEDGREDIISSAWGRGPKKLFEFPAKFRIVPDLPYLQKWGN